MENSKPALMLPLRSTSFSSLDDDNETLKRRRAKPTPSFFHQLYLGIRSSGASSIILHSDNHASHFQKLLSNDMIPSIDAFHYPMQQLIPILLKEFGVTDVNQVNIINDNPSSSTPEPAETEPEPEESTALLSMLEDPCKLVSSAGESTFGQSFSYNSEWFDQDFSLREDDDCPISQKSLDPSRNRTPDSSRLSKSFSSTNDQIVCPTKDKSPVSVMGLFVGSIEHIGSI